MNNPTSVTTIVKVSFNNTLRKFTLSPESNITTFQDFESKLKELHNIPITTSVSVTYTDSDNDEILLSTTNEFNEMVSSESTLRVNLRVVQDPFQDPIVVDNNNNNNNSVVGGKSKGKEIPVNDYSNTNTSEELTVHHVASSSLSSSDSSSSLTTRGHNKNNDKLVDKKAIQNVIIAFQAFWAALLPILIKIWEKIGPSVKRGYNEKVVPFLEENKPKIEEFFRELKKKKDGDHKKDQ